MNESELESEPEEITRRQRLGRVVFFVGCLLAAFSVLSVVTVSVAASTGMVAEVSTYTSFAVPIGILGVLLILVGLAVVLLPDGPSRDGVWVMMMGGSSGGSG